MELWTFSVGAFVLGAVLAGLLTALRLQKQVTAAQARLVHQEGQLERAQQELLETRRAQSDALSERLQAETELASLKERLQAREEQLTEQKKLFAAAEEKLTHTFRSVGLEALKANSERFLELANEKFSTILTDAKGDVDKKQQAIDALVKPIRELLDKQNTKLADIEKQREADKSGLQKHLELLAQAHDKLNTETSRLVTALRRPEQRGRWGEMQLRNVVELAGMSKHCDFSEQAQTDDPNTRHRPDMIVHLPGDGVIVVDSKVSLDAYLNSIQPDADREGELLRHVGQVETHVRQLASKAYWDQFERTPRLVVMFMPLESALHAALEIKPDLHTKAMQEHVLIATPTLLVAMLRAVAYGWQQEAIAENAREIANVGRDLYDRLATFTSHLTKVGKGLEGANKAYNSAIGSLERSLLPGARRLRELHATQAKEIDGPEPIETEVREVTAPELKQIVGGEK